MPQGGRHHCAYASLDGNSHFLFGGFDKNGASSSEVVFLEYYNSTLQYWVDVPLPEEAFGSAATAIDDDHLLVVGGVYPSMEKVCVLYDNRSREESTDWPILNIGRHNHASVYTHNKKAYVIGGCNSNDGPLDSIEEIDLSLGTPGWRVLAQRLVLDAAPLRILKTPTT